MATIDNDRVSVIVHGGTWQTIQLLRTTPVLALDGGVTSVQLEGRRSERPPAAAALPLSPGPDTGRRRQ